MKVYIRQVFVNVQRNFVFSRYHVRQVVKNYLQPCEPSIAFHIETSHLICNANQVTVLYGMQHWAETG